VIISATERVFENGALNTGTPRVFASRSATWLVPMQKQPTASRRRASASAAGVTRVFDRMPSTCTSLIFSTSSLSLSAPDTASTEKPSPRKISCADAWTFSSRRTLI
jgi:hypothetical protein